MEERNVASRRCAPIRNRHVTSHEPEFNWGVNEFESLEFFIRVKINGRAILALEYENHFGKNRKDAVD
jgi:hypothetical protein